jgi:hypothetical protein
VLPAPEITICTSWIFLPASSSAFNKAVLDMLFHVDHRDWNIQLFLQSTFNLKGLRLISSRLIPPNVGVNVLDRRNSFYILIHLYQRSKLRYVHFKSKPSFHDRLTRRTHISPNPKLPYCKLPQRCLDF